MKFYTGVGSRQTPKHILGEMVAVGRMLSNQGYGLRSGRADGADAAFQAGAMLAYEDGSKTESEIYVPWRKFNESRPLRPSWLWITEQAPNLLMAKKLLLNVMDFHHWNACSRAARQLHIRNVYQVLGHNLDNESKFLLYWAKTDKHGKPQGGTRTAVLLAQLFNIPTINMADGAWRSQLAVIMEKQDAV